MDIAEDESDIPLERLPARDAENELVPSQELDAAIAAGAEIYKAMITVDGFAHVFAADGAFEEEVCSTTRACVAPRAALSCAAPRRRTPRHGRRAG